MKFLKQKWLALFVVFPLLLIANPIEDTPRDYWKELSQEQHANMSFILSTMSRANHAQIVINKSKLRQASDKLANIHPLRNLEHVFTHPELLRDLCGISRRKNFIWPSFLNGEDNGMKEGMIGSFKQEDALGNIKPEHIENFTRRTNLSYIRITNSIRSKNWNEMIDYVVIEAMNRNAQELYDL